MISSISAKTWRQAALVLLALATLSACGQKGPLYLPEPAPEGEAAGEEQKPS